MSYYSIFSGTSSYWVARKMQRRLISLWHQLHGVWTEDGGCRWIGSKSTEKTKPWSLIFQTDITEYHSLSCRVKEGLCQLNYTKVCWIICFPSMCATGWQSLPALIKFLFLKRCDLHTTFNWRDPEIVAVIRERQLLSRLHHNQEWPSSKD